MKSSVIFKTFLVIAALFLSSWQNNKPDNPKQKTDISEFMGQWTIDINGGAVGWLEVRQEEGYPDADLLWGGGSVLPAAYVFLADNVLYVGRSTRKVVRKKDSKGNETRSMTFPAWLSVRKEGNKITGFLINPRPDGIAVDSISFTGSKLPDVPPAPDLTRLKYGKPVVLFNGKDLTGWKSVSEKLKNPFHVVDGVLVKDPVQVEGEPRVRFTEMRTEQEFEDFNLKFDVNVPKGCNSGVYLRGLYEIAIEEGHADSGGKELDSHNIGGVYSRISPTVNAERPAGTWQTLNVTLCNRHVTVFLNGTRIIDNQPLYGPTGGAISSNVFAPGPIILQGTERGKVEYRNIVLTPIVK